VEPLTPAQLTRYSRQLVLPEIGGLGQRRLASARVAIAHLDAAGQAALVYLVAAGVGCVAVPAEGTVATCGALFEAEDLGQPALARARVRVRALNPHVTVEPPREGDHPVATPLADDAIEGLAAGAAAARAMLLVLAQEVA
jgi:molybdopterin/thiamine biosynthesis adenylyltransferase